MPGGAEQKRGFRVGNLQRPEDPVLHALAPTSAALGRRRTAEPAMYDALCSSNPWLPTLSTPWVVEHRETLRTSQKVARKDSRRPAPYGGPRKPPKMGNRRASAYGRCRIREGPAQPHAELANNDQCSTRSLKEQAKRQKAKVRCTTSTPG